MIITYLSFDYFSQEHIKYNDYNHIYMFTESIGAFIIRGQLSYIFYANFVNMM